MKRASVSVTDFSPLGVGPCFTLTLSRAATRNADRALPGVTARMGGSDFHAPPPASSLLHLFAGARLQRTDAPLCAVLVLEQAGYHVFSMSGSIRPRTPGSTHAARQSATRIVACRGDKPVGTLRLNFRGSTPSGSASPVTAHLASLSGLRINASVTSYTARLDTGLAAHDYPGGTSTR